MDFDLLSLVAARRGVPDTQEQPQPAPELSTETALVPVVLDETAIVAVPSGPILRAGSKGGNRQYYVIWNL
jgi:hypothetical protein